MAIIFDTTKDQANIAKHGMSLADTSKLGWRTLITVIDDRKEYGEVREVGLA
jgi:hypothetical protein